MYSITLRTVKAKDVIKPSGITCAVDTSEISEQEIIKKFMILKNKHQNSRIYYVMHINTVDKNGKKVGNHFHILIIPGPKEKINVLDIITLFDMVDLKSWQNVESDNALIKYMSHNGTFEVKEA